MAKILGGRRHADQQARRRRPMSQGAEKKHLMTGSSVPGRRTALRDPELAAGMARRWWLFIVTGSLWILFSLIVSRFDLDSVTAIGIAIGAFCFAAGVNEFLTLGATPGGSKVVRVILGVLFVVIGVVALAYPNRTFVEVASSRSSAC